MECRRRIPAWVLALAAVWCAAPAHASIIMVAGSVSASPGDIGDSLEIYLTNTGPNSVTLGAFSLGVQAPAGSGVMFTSATFNTVLHPYVFAGVSAFGSDITSPGQTLPGALILASDITSEIAGINVAAGTSVGLGLVFFNIDAGAAIGPMTLTLLDFPSSSLSDPIGNDLAIDQLVNGRIDVIPGSSIPEPASLALIGAGLGLLGALRRRLAEPRSA